MEKKDFHEEIEMLHSNEIEKHTKIDIAKRIIKEGGSEEFIKIASLVLSYEPDTRWGKVNPFESLITPLYEKSLTELHSKSIQQNENLLMALDIIGRFNDEDYKVVPELLKFIETYSANEEIKPYAIKCICRILYRHDNPFGIPGVYDLFYSEVKEISNARISNSKAIIPLLTISTDPRSLGLIYEIVDSLKTPIEIKYFLYKHVYGNFATDSLKEVLIEKGKAFLFELSSYSEFSQEASILENIMPQ